VSGSIKAKFSDEAGKCYKRKWKLHSRSCFKILLYFEVASVRVNGDRRNNTLASIRCHSANKK
jgi:hypothetical protein